MLCMCYAYDFVVESILSSKAYSPKLKISRKKAVSENVFLNAKQTSGKKLSK